MTLLEGAGYLLVAMLLAARPVPDELRTGSRLFQGWWAGIGLNKVIAGVVGLAATYDAIDGTAYVSVLYLNFVILASGLWCLLAYFAFLYTGGKRAFVALGLLCGGFFLLLSYNLLASQPTGYTLGTWRTSHARTFDSPVWRNLLTLALLVVLPAAPALAHLRLLKGLEERSQKYRVVLVSAGIVLWTLSVFFVAFRGSESSALLQVSSRTVGLLGALAALWAYRPPSWVRRWLGEGNGFGHATAR